MRTFTGHLSKKQKHMKKWIPYGPYCEGMLGDGGCPFHQVLWYKVDKEYYQALKEAIKLHEQGVDNDLYRAIINPEKSLKQMEEYLNNPMEHKPHLCQFNGKKGCKLLNENPDACKTCNEKITRCAFLDYTEYGDFPLGDLCKICGIHNWKNTHLTSWEHQYTR